MGYDYTSSHLFAGTDGVAMRDAAIALLKSSISNPAAEADATRSFVVGPAGRWIFIGDSACQTDDPDPVAAAETRSLLSHLTPLVVFLMSDSCVVEISLYREGRLVDSFCSGIFPVMSFSTAEQAAESQGNVSKWSDYLLSPDFAPRLREAWRVNVVGNRSPDRDADDTVQSTAELLGIDLELAGVGYTIFDEADEIKYSDWLNGAEHDLSQFAELHFNAPRRSYRGQ